MIGCTTSCFICTLSIAIIIFSFDSIIHINDINIWIIY